MNNQEDKNVSKNLLDSLNDFFNDLLNISRDSHEENTIKTIRGSISMKGHNAWILVFSIFIASIGLNANSTAVVIGAMLISPLMGPILGIGLSIGINDVDMMRRSLVNLGVMVGLSLLTSFLYFSIPLFQEQTPEIVARVRPDVRDVLIALSGGLALIVAISRPTPQTNTVAGVAIATALMPPLCVAGYGLALGNYNYFLGAMFLFTINSIFIAIATFAIVRYLRFSMVKYIDQGERKRISRIASAVAVVIVAVSLYSFYRLIQEKQYTEKAMNFIQEIRDDGYALIGDDEDAINYSNKRISLQFLGNVDDDTIHAWEQDLVDMNVDAELTVRRQDDSEIRQQVETLQDLYAQNQKLISTRDESIREKDDRIRLLEQELSTYYESQIDFKTLSEEALINYPELNQLSLSRQFNTNFQALDTLTVIEVNWKQDVKKEKIDEAQPKLQQWLEKRLAVDSLVLRRR